MATAVLAVSISNFLWGRGLFEGSAVESAAGDVESEESLGIAVL